MVRRCSRSALGDVESEIQRIRGGRSVGESRRHHQRFCGLIAPGTILASLRRASAFDRCQSTAHSQVWSQTTVCGCGPRIDRLALAGYGEPGPEEPMGATTATKSEQCATPHPMRSGRFRQAPSAQWSLCGLLEVCCGVSFEQRWSSRGQTEVRLAVRVGVSTTPICCTRRILRQRRESGGGSIPTTSRNKNATQIAGGVVGLFNFDMGRVSEGCISTVWPHVGSPQELESSRLILVNPAACQGKLCRSHML